MFKYPLKTQLETNIDRGFTIWQWEEQQAAASKNPTETVMLGGRDKSILRLDYSILEELQPNDSVFIPPNYNIAQVRAAAFGRANKFNWAIMSRRSVEGGLVGIRIFRIA
jgi:hypothetical protein